MNWSTPADIVLNVGLAVLLMSWACISVYAFWIDGIRAAIFPFNVFKECRFLLWGWLCGLTLTLLGSFLGGWL